MWAATATGRVFISDNANASRLGVTWTRLDTSSAERSADGSSSSIYVDPANPNHAWISYSGYNFNTPTTPGHVFEVTRTGSTATWTDMTNNLADLPVTDLVRDDLTGDLYAVDGLRRHEARLRLDHLDGRGERHAAGRGAQA